MEFPPLFFHPTRGFLFFPPLSTFPWISPLPTLGYYSALGFPLFPTLACYPPWACILKVRVLFQQCTCKVGNIVSHINAKIRSKSFAILQSVLNGRRLYLVALGKVKINQGSKLKVENKQSKALKATFIFLFSRHAPLACV